MSTYVPDVEIVDVDEWTEEHTQPGRVTTAQLVAECEAMALVRAWLDEQEQEGRR